jgi:hypothetical protein
MSEMIDASYGSSLWAFKQWRRGALVALMHDLIDLTDTGFRTADECTQVKRSLEKVCVLLSAVPDRSFLCGSMMGAMQRFADAYAYWNDEPHKPENAHRAKEIRQKGMRRMQNYRHQFAKYERRNMHILQNELDLKLVTDLYAALGVLTASLPDVFKGLRKSIERFGQRSYDK